MERSKQQRSKIDQKMLPEKCPLCPTEFSSSATLESHVREAHLQTGEINKYKNKSPGPNELKLHKGQVHEGEKQQVTPDVPEKAELKGGEVDVSGYWLGAIKHLTNVITALKSEGGDDPLAEMGRAMNNLTNVIGALNRQCNELLVENGALKAKLAGAETSMQRSDITSEDKQHGVGVPGEGAESGGVLRSDEAGGGDGQCDADQDGRRPRAEGNNNSGEERMQDSESDKTEEGAEKCPGSGDTNRIGSSENEADPRHEVSPRPEDLLTSSEDEAEEDMDAGDKVVSSNDPVVKKETPQAPEEAHDDIDIDELINAPDSEIGDKVFGDSDEEEEFANLRGYPDNATAKVERVEEGPDPNGDSVLKRKGTETANSTKSTDAAQVRTLNSFRRS